MKKILLLLAAALFLLSCEKEEIMATLSTDPVPPSITGMDNGFSVTVTEAKLSDKIKWEWNRADYGVATQVTYTLQVAAEGKAFSDAVVLGTTQNNTFTLSLQELNTKLLDELKAAPNAASPVEFRVVASIRDKFQEISPVVKSTVTTFKAIVTGPAKLWVPGSYQGWNPSAAPIIYSVSNTEYEGYVYFQEGAGFKFTSAPDWDHINYGDSGTPGKLTTDGLANGLSATEPGYYRFKVNVSALTYEMYKVASFGLIGTATPGSWDNSTPLTFDPATSRWTKTLSLVSGALKFRANNDWWLNYGPEDSNALSGKLIHTDGAITISEPGTYTVTLDFTRAKAPLYQYSYTVVKN